MLPAISPRKPVKVLSEQNGIPGTGVKESPRRQGNADKGKQLRGTITPRRPLKVTAEDMTMVAQLDRTKQLRGNISPRRPLNVTADDMTIVAHRPSATTDRPAADGPADRGTQRITSLALDPAEESGSDRSTQMPKVVPVGQRQHGRSAAPRDSLESVKDMVPTEALDFIARGRFKNRPAGAKSEPSPRRHPQLNLSGRVEFLGQHQSHADSQRQEAVYQQLLKRDPTNLKTLRDYGSWLHEMRRLQEAEKTYRFALKLSIIDVEVLSGYATLLWDMGKPQKACDMFQLALEREPSYIPTLLSYGLSLLAIGSKPVALLQFRKALELDSSNSRALLYCAVALEDLGRADTTVISELYAKSAAEDPNNVEGLHAYARFLKAKMQDYDKAQEIYEQALSIQHNDVDVLCSYGALLSERTPYEQGRFKRAETCYKLALQVEPDNVDTLYNFAVLLWSWDRHLYLESGLEVPDRQEREDRLLRAEAMYKKALQLRPLDADVLCSYSMFLLEEQRSSPLTISRAEKLLRTALHVAPRHRASCMAYARLLRQQHAERAERWAAELEARARGEVEKAREDGSIQAVKQMELSWSEGERADGGEREDSGGAGERDRAREGERRGETEGKRGWRRDGEKYRGKNERGREGGRERGREGVREGGREGEREGGREGGREDRGRTERERGGNPDEEDQDRGGGEREGLGKGRGLRLDVGREGAWEGGEGEREEVLLGELSLMSGT